MLCLSVQEPWAWAIIHGPKRVENRSWRTSYRGPLLIHAARSRARLGLRRLPDGTPVPAPDQLVFGALLGMVDLTDCVPLRRAPRTPFTEGPQCLLLENPRPLRVPVPYRGRQRLFHVPDEFVRDPAGYLLFRLQ